MRSNHLQAPLQRTQPQARASRVDEGNQSRSLLASRAVWVGGALALLAWTGIIRALA